MGLRESRTALGEFYFAKKRDRRNFCMNQGESIIISAEALKTLRETRYNPGRNITATKLASILEAFQYGDIRDAALLWEQIAERDDTIKSVKPKREKSVSGLIPAYEAAKGSGAVGEQQREVLEKFWSNVRATDAYDRNVSGGLRLLIQQWMYAVSFRYAVHHIVWSPRSTGLTATFEHVPLWLFENKTGKLRFLRNPFNVNGEDMEPGEWLVTAGEGLMIAVSIGWLAKRDTYNDWLIFSSRFSTPGILGRTRAAQDSDEGRAMKQAVMAFGRELKAVCYGDDGSIKDPIQIIQADGTPAGQPMPSLIERIDRKFSALYRGNDLGTMSAGSGEGTGASLQGEETDILLTDDVALCEEKFAEVSRMVLEWNFGADVEIFASVKLKHRKDLEAETKASPAPARVALENAEEVRSDPSAVSSENDELFALLQDGYADVAAVLDEALQASGSERARLLQEAAGMLPDAIENEELEDAVTELLTRAFLGEVEDEEEVEWESEDLGDGDAEEVENVGNSLGAVLGWLTRRANGWENAPKMLKPADADALLKKGFQVKSKKGEKVRFGKELLTKLDSKVVNPVDRNARKQRLNWASLAVTDGKESISMRKGQKRTIFAKTFRRGKKHQDIEVIVDMKNGVAWNIMVKGGSANDVK
jgi:hypothetical protein